MNGVTAQNVIDNEVLSDNNTGNDSNNEENDNNTGNDSNNDEDDSSQVNEFPEKPLVHVSIEGTEINDKIRGGPGDDTISGEEGSDNLQGQEGNDEIGGGEGEDSVDGLEGEDELRGGEDDDDIRGGEDDDEIDGGEGEDSVDGGGGEDELKGGKGADRFVCDTTDKIIDYNSLENDIIVGKCVYEDKGLISKPIPDKDPLFPSSQIPASQDNNFNSFASKNSIVADSKESSFEKLISNFIDIDIPNLLR